MGDDDFEFESREFCLVITHDDVRAGIYDEITSSLFRSALKSGLQIRGFSYLTPVATQKMQQMKPKGKKKGAGKRLST